MPKAMKKNEALNGVVHSRKATLVKSEEIKDSLTFVMVSEQNEGTRYSWDMGEFVERLDISGANMDRLNTFFKNHNRDVDAAIGRVENKRLDGTSLLADVVFDKSGEDIKRKFENGTLTDVSIGYSINKYEVEERKGEPDMVTVTDFDIFELSAVGIGFDQGAKYTGRESQQTEQGEIMLKELMERLAKLEGKSKRSDEENTEIRSLQSQINAEREKETAALKAENLELSRKQEIINIAKSYNPSDTLRTQFEEKGTGSEFMRAILDERASTQPSVPATVAGDDNKRADMLDAMSDAIALRSGATLSNPHKDVAEFRGASILDMAKRVTDSGGYDRNTIASRAMSTSDFPQLLINAGNRILEQSFDEQSSTYQGWVKEVDVADFRTMTDITMGNTGVLSEIQENGEFKEKQITEASEDWKIKSYGAEFILTRQMIINDDLGAFTSLQNEFGRMAKRTANKLTYNMLQRTGAFSSYKMKDGKPIFDSAHKNLGTAAKLNATSLEAARTAIRRQKSANGNALNIMPKYLIIAPEQEITARTLLSSVASTEANTNAGVINPFYNMLQIIVDAELPSGAWYLAGDSRTLKVGYLSGSGRRPIVQIDTQSLTRTVFKGVFDFGVMAEDHRALYKTPGV